MIWCFTLVLIKINYGQIGDQTGLFYTTNQYLIPVEIDFSVVSARLGISDFLTVPSDNCNTRSTCPTSVFTGIGQTLMSRPAETTMHCKVTCILYKKQAHFSQLFCLQVRSVTPWQLHDRKSRCLRGRQHS